MPAQRDILGGRIGSQASRINCAVAAQGGTAESIAMRIGEPLANVSAQLSWLYGRGRIERTRGFSGVWFYSFNGVEQAHAAAVARGAVLTQAAITDRTFGVELEILIPAGPGVQGVVAKLREIGIECRYAGYTHAVSTEWKLVNDSSVHSSGIAGYVGVELVSPILRGTEGEEQVRKVSAALLAHGCKVNRTCGLHVHIDNGGYTPQRKRKIYETYGRIEYLIDTLMPESRRGHNNMFCRSCTSTPYGDSRYMKLNAAMLERTHRTIEFRQHSGTIEATKILPWVRFAKSFVSCTDFERLGNCASLEQVLQVLALSEEDTQYFLNRARQLDRSARQAA